jgi:2-polyprenyl-6-methoxyphenol hydroxylase-like FAD-dependent oxidoreductase
MATSLPNRITCCIAGGGPAGVMLGLLLGRAGVEVLVLEKHQDFLRDFRGDTIHPSTLQVMHELGLLDDLLKRPHQEVRELRGIVGDTRIKLADFGHLPTRCRFIALMPQWDFLDFLADSGRRYPGFHLAMRAEVTDLIEEGGRIAGVRGHTQDGPFEMRADLVIGADGRHSVVRERAGLKVDNLGAPIDVLWMRLSKLPNDPRETGGRINFGKMLVMLDRGDYWQCAFVIRKDGFAALRKKGIDAFRRDIVQIAPFLHDRAPEVRDWDDVKLLTVTVDRLEKWWRPGLLCIGDCAHAMSPVGGVGINLAIQDAVAAGNILGEKLRTGALGDDDLAAVERRRILPTRLTQAMQVIVQERVIDRVLDSDKPITAPWPLRLFNAVPLLARIPARLIGMGFRPEHVRTPAVPAPAAAARR